MSEQPSDPAKRTSVRALVLIVGLVVLIGLGTYLFTRGAAPSPPPASPGSNAPTPAGVSVAGPTAVPTLDFFRGRSYPTPTTQAAP